MNFRAFPFDTQELLIQLEALAVKDEQGNMLAGIDLLPSATGESMLTSKGGEQVDACDFGLWVVV
jgi:hypothetical protein